MCGERGGELDTEIEVPFSAVHTVSGSQLSDLIEGDHYYASFKRMLDDRTANRDQYKQHLFKGKDELRRGIEFRAHCISISHKYNISYLEAREIAANCPKFNRSYIECIDIVVDNYLTLLDQRRPLRVFGKIDANGKVIVVEGLHRVLINSASGFATSSMIVLSRDNEWIKFIDFFRNESSRLYGNTNSLYHKIDHPDFSGFDIIREDRSGPIIEYLRQFPNIVRGVDIGSMIGFYTHKLAANGFQMTAIEYEYKYATAAQRLNKTYNLDCTVVNRDVFQMTENDFKFDFAIMLSVLYHFVRNDENKCQRLLEVLKKNIPLFFIDTEERTGILPEEKMRAMFAEYNIDKIYAGKDQRNVFAISKPSD